MIEAIIMLIACIARILYLSITGIVLTIIVHMLIYQVTGISIYKLIVKGVK